MKGLTVRLASGAVVELVPVGEPPGPDPDPQGELWYLENYAESGLTVPDGQSNFMAMPLYADAAGKTAGQSNWVELDPQDYGPLVLGLNGILFGSPTWHYLVAPTSRIYRTINEADPDVVGASIRWPRIAIASKGDGERNQVLVTAYSADRRFARVAGIPHSPTGDYSAYSIERQPWFFHRDYCIYQNEVVGDSPKGILYMALLDPASGFKISMGEDGLWLPTDWLHSQVGAEPAPNPAIVHELYTLPDSGIVAHLYYMDLARVVPFVTPALGAKLTVQGWRERYGMDFAINGDGGPWLAGPLMSAGRWMSGGAWLSQNTGEGSVWFDAAGGAAIGYGKPAGMAPVNVISGPRILVRGGAVQPSDHPDTPPAPCSAFGLFSASRAVAIAIEGDEDMAIGASESQLAALCVGLGLQDAIRFDSGGSTSASQRYGVSYSVEQRPVLNALCFKGK